MSEQNGLPPGWAWTNVADIAHVQGGIQKQPKRAPKQHAFPYLRVANVLRGRLDLAEIERMELYGNELETLRLETGDLLIVEGNGSVTEIGRSALWHGAIQDCVHQNHIIRVRLVAGCPQFLDYFWNSPAGTRQVTEVASSTSGLYTLSVRKVAAMRIPLPPLAEQHRIVVAIEQQFTRLDAGVAALRRVRAALKRYRAAVLKAAVEGRLTEAWRAAHPDAEPAASARYRTFKATDATATIRQARRLWGAGHVAHASDEVRYALPNTWELCKVRDLGADPTDVVQVGPMSMKSSEFTETGLPVLNVGCVRWGGFDLSKLNYLPTNIAAGFGRYRLAPNDVVFTRSGTVGRCAIVRADQDGWLMTFHLLRVRADSRVCRPDYLTYVMEGSPHVREQIEGASIGSTRAGFNTRLLEELDVPLPPLAEQEAIVAEVERQLSVVSEVEATIEANLTRAERLRQSILERAFSGRLVPQDPRDEPASALLERIRAEREARAAHGLTRRNGRNGGDGRESADAAEEAEPVTARRAGLWDEG